MDEKTRPEQVATTTADVVADQVERLKSIFPEAVTEGKVDFKKLRATLGAFTDDRPERYDFSWAGKQKATRLLQSKSQATLRPVRDESVNFDEAQNVFIEGENLETLKLLYKAYSEQVKMIYIDPPYNKNKDFIYQDNFLSPLSDYLKITGQKGADGHRQMSNLETSGRYHSSWLSMMYPRLFLARQLLQEDGVIFISIDDQEVYVLRMLMNELFGEENFVGVMKRRAARKTAHLSASMSDMCDYVVVYCKDELQAPLSVEEISDETRPVFNRGNPISERRIPAGSESRYSDGVYEKGSYTVRTLSFELKDDLYIKDGTTQNEVTIAGPFRINQDVLEKTVYITSHFGLRRYLLEEEHGKAKTLTDLVDEPDLYNEKGTEEIAALLGGDYFESPKPVGLVKFLINAVSTPDDKDFTVLDFFAGSSTTAQAVMELNREDNGDRRFILAQLPEPVPENHAARQANYETIAELGRDRIKQVVQKMEGPSKSSPDDVKGGAEFGGLGFRSFKLTASNFNQWEGPPAGTAPEGNGQQLNAAGDVLKANAEREDVIYEVALKEGYSLLVDIQQAEDVEEAAVWKVVDDEGGSSFYICLDDDLSPAALESLALNEDDLFICRDTALNDANAAERALRCRLKVI